MVTKLISRDQKLTLARASKMLGAFAVFYDRMPLPADSARPVDSI
jgi:hypothetical protein